MTSISRPSIIGLIPARAGSKRVAGKNIRSFAGHPMMAYSIAVARASGVFDAIVVSTDSEEYAAIARHYGAEVPFLRPVEMAGTTSADIEWIDYTLRRLAGEGRQYDCFSILRPTCPFRKADTIARAWAQFRARPAADSLRAVEKCREHPGKMWVERDGYMLPLLPFGPAELPWHSTPYQALPEIYIQNASLEIAWSRVVLKGKTIAGTVILPFKTEGTEGFDINVEEDWLMANILLNNGEATLPPVPTAPWIAG
jgi:CMP-N,N'-diacetyllegionaminic acid synthase